jgi:hypothetical protein
MKDDGIKCKDKRRISPSFSSMSHPLVIVGQSFTGLVERPVCNWPFSYNLPGRRWCLSKWHSRTQTNRRFV